MTRRAAVWLLSAVLLAIAGCATPSGAPKPEAAVPPGAASAPPTASPAAAYRLQIDAPAALRPMLASFLDLSRFQNATGDDGVTSTELARLVALAPAQARSLLETEGYFGADVKVEPVEPVERSAGAPPVVRVKVDPGPRTQVASVDLRVQGPLAAAADAGDPRAVATRRAVAAQWLLKAGEPWRQPAWSTAKLDAVARLRSQGYAAAALVESRARIDAPNQRAALDATIDSGPLYRLGAMRIEGLARYGEDAVRNVAQFDTGEPYTEQKLQEFQDRLGRVGLFDSVSVELDPDPAHADAATVRVRVRELQAQQATVGIGYSANTGQRLTFEHVHRRVFGWNWRARSKIELGRDLQSAETEFTSHPHPNNWRDLVGGGVERLYSAGSLRESLRVRVGRTRETVPIDRLYYLELTRANVHTEATDTTSTATALFANYQWVFRYVDNVLLPTRGVTASAQAGSGYSLASDAPNGPFGRAVGRVTFYRPFGRWVTQARLEAGQVFAKNGVGIPDTLLFRVGGDDSVRGYAYRTLGPTDAAGTVSSGRILLTTSVEVAHPISPRRPEFLWALFVDAGTAANSWQGLHLSLGYGAGLRWRSPVGPLRVDLAYGQDVHKPRLHVSVGVTF